MEKLHESFHWLYESAVMLANYFPLSYPWFVCKLHYRLVSTLLLAPMSFFGFTSEFNVSHRMKQSK